MRGSVRLRAALLQDRQRRAGEPPQKNMPNKAQSNNDVYTYIYIYIYIYIMIIIITIIASIIIISLTYYNIIQHNII